MYSDPLNPSPSSSFTLYLVISSSYCISFHSFPTFLHSVHLLVSIDPSFADSALLMTGLTQCVSCAMINAYYLVLALSS